MSPDATSEQLTDCNDNALCQTQGKVKVLYQDLHDKCSVTQQLKIIWIK